MNILIAGSTGLVGGDIALKLKQKGHHVFALARGGNSNPKSQRLRAAGVEIFEGDLTQPETLFAVCRGAEVVITTATSMPTAANDDLRRVDRDGSLALIDAAERQGVRRFIYTSYSGNIEQDCPLRDAKRECEARLLSGSMEAVILRPSYFMEVWLSPALGFEPANGRARIYGSGNERVSFISAFDVADFAVAATTRQYQQKSSILEMGGPEALSQRDVVLLFEQALGKEINTESVPVDVLRGQHQSSDPLQKTFAALMLGYAQGDIVRDALSNALSHGVVLTSVADYAAGFHARAASARM
jgi:NADH dehydrogenase